MVTDLFTSLILGLSPESGQAGEGRVGGSCTQGEGQHSQQTFGNLNK